MKIKIYLGAILLFLCSTQIVFAQDKTTTEQKKVLICSDCRIDKPISMPQPEYPPAARAVHASGAVQVQITIDESGNVVEAKAISGNPLLHPSAVKAALQAKFKTVLLGGNAVRARGVITYNFILDEQIQPKKAQDKYISGGIINGKAIELPKPAYSQEAKDFCASGIVKVAVLIGKDGNVISAEAISGDELLRDSAVEAAKKAKFSQTPDVTPIKIKGIVVYNFPAEKRCIEKGVINNRATYLPKPVFPAGCRCKGVIDVRVLVDVSSGKVVTANAFSGHPLLRASAVKAAREARFGVANIDGDGKPVYVKGILVYDFDSDGSVQTEQSEKANTKVIVDLSGGTVTGKAIKLPKPQIPFCNCIWGNGKGVTSVLVETEIDEQGNVSKTTAISGHPLLKIISEKAAQKSKFSPSLINNEQVKAKATIVYKFLILNKRSVKFASVEVKDIQIENQTTN